VAPSLNYCLSSQTHDGGFMLFTLDSKNQINDLNLDLRTFGLNPADWMVLKERSQTYRVKSKKDQNFIFQGKAQKKGKKLSWELLELVSI
jgi:hypothetical protein